MLRLLQRSRIASRFSPSIITKSMDSECALGVLSHTETVTDFVLYVNRPSSLISSEHETHFSVRVQEPLELVASLDELREKGARDPRVTSAAPPRPSREQGYW